MEQAPVFGEVQRDLADVLTVQQGRDASAPPTAERQIAVLQEGFDRIVARLESLERTVRQANAARLGGAP